MGNKKILVLEDDPITNKILQKALTNEYELTQCETIVQAAELVRQRRYDLFILDRQLPDGDGLDFCRQLREIEGLQDTPVIFLTGSDTENDKVISLLSGGTDYMTKPFGILELKARIAVQFRSAAHKLFTSSLEIDLDAFSVKLRSCEQTKFLLTPLEFKLLVTFIKNKERVLTRQDLLNSVWKSNLNISDRAVDTHVSQLRKKLINCNLKFESYRGEGYKLSEAG